MESVVMLVDPVPGRRGVYEFPKVVALSMDEPIETLEGLKSPRRERGKVKVNGKEVVMSVYVATYGGDRYPYVLLSDVEGLL